MVGGRNWEERREGNCVIYEKRINEKEKKSELNGIFEGSLSLNDVLGLFF